MKLHPLDTDIKAPERFTYPFNYTPHPLCLLAARQLQDYVSGVDAWREELDCGKMLGVLVVRDGSRRLGFLAAYSGLLCGRNDWPYFVPSVYDSTSPDGYFKRHEREIDGINEEISQLEHSMELKRSRQLLTAAREQAEAEIDGYRAIMRESKQRRDDARAGGSLSPEEQAAFIRESQFQKAELKRIKARCAAHVASVAASVDGQEQDIARLKRKRKELSDSLQHWLFSRYDLLNAKGERRNLLDIFKSTPQGVPPSGAGDCCAPKLLQYAYRNGMKPVCMAEFWWGKSPKSEIRHHLHFYPACRSKCKPILGFMMQGLDVDPNPHDLRGGDAAALQIVYHDESIVVVNKPSGMLSMPGLVNRRSVVDALREEFCAEGYFMPAHRLDMDTSGLLVVARSEEALRKLHEQFAAGTVVKRYSAVLCGEATALPRRGTIRLPLSADAADRPRQIVDRDNGKPAVTGYEITRIADGKTYLKLFPHTGRTHQLRVHCAHSEGLSLPIEGDSLYGHPSAERLMLHAEYIRFRHPSTGAPMQFELPMW